MKRRDFIKLSLFSAISILLPNSLTAKTIRNKTLVLVELEGGNDGLNTLVPFTNKNYYKFRPFIGLKEKQINIIEKDFALNKSLRWVTKFYKDKNCAIIQGLGFKDSSLSHFKALENVQEPKSPIENKRKSWLDDTLNRFSLDEKMPAHGIIIGKGNKANLFSNDLKVLQVKNINEFIENSSFSNFIFPEYKNEAFLFLEKEEKLTKKAITSFKRYIKDETTKIKFEESELSKAFEEAFKLIKSELNIPVIKILQKGYDTHSEQLERQNLLLKQLDNALVSFVKNLKEEKLFDEVLIVTYSEFGRRAKENASKGTDHGRASCQFVLGGKVKGGLYGKAVSLEELDTRGNLIATTDYRSFYNTILTKWFNHKENRFKNYKMIDFL